MPSSRRGVVAGDVEHGDDVPVGMRARHPRGHPGAVVDREVPAQAGGVDRRGSPRRVGPVDHPGEPPVLPERVARVEVAVDQAVGERRRRAARELDGALPDLRTARPPGHREPLRRHVAPVARHAAGGVDRVDRLRELRHAVDQDVRVELGARRTAGEEAHEQRRDAAALAVGVGGEQARRRDGRVGEQLQDGGLPARVELGVGALPAGAGPAAQHDGLRASQLDRVVSVEARAGQVRDPARLRTGGLGHPVERAHPPGSSRAWSALSKSSAAASIRTESQRRPSARTQSRRRPITRKPARS